MAGYMRQEDIKPIIAKKWAVDHWKDYDITDTKEDFIALLNILQAVGENLDTLHNAVFNGYAEFCDIFHNGCWESDREVANALFEFCTFYTKDEFIDMILDRAEDYKEPGKWEEDIRRETSDASEDNNDCQITKTEDGYVRRIWC